MSLVAWYPLNGILKDKGLEGNDLRIDIQGTSETIDFNTNGKMGGESPTFTGVTGNGLVAPNFIQDVNNWQSNFSWAFWAKIDSLTSTYQYLISTGRDVGNIGFNFTINSSGIICIDKVGRKSSFNKCLFSIK